MNGHSVLVSGSQVGRVNNVAEDLKASNDRIHSCVRGGNGDVYELTSAGRRALEVPWGQV